MKKIYFISLFFILQSAVWSQPQLTVTATGNNCQADVKYLSVNFGTVTPGNVSWMSTPAGAVFSVSPSTATVSFPSAGPYTVLAILASQNGIFSGGMSFTIIPSPTITLSQTSLTTCIVMNPDPQIPYSLSKPIALQATGASSYSLFPYPGLPTGLPGPGGYTVRPQTTSCYTVVGEAANGCTAAAVKCVTVIPQFTIQVAPSPANICMNASVSLYVNNIQSTANGPSSSFTYNWYEATNAPPPSLNSYGTSSVSAYPQNTTTYTVEVLDATGCVSSPAFVQVNVNLCTAIEENGLATHWLAVPNPVKNKFKLSSEVKGDVQSIELSNTLGEMVYTKQGINPEEEIDLTFLASGVYFVRVESKAGKGIVKIIKD